MNIGSYSWSHLESIKHQLDAYRNYSEDADILQSLKRMQIDTEDIFLSKEMTYNPGQHEVSSPINFYGTDTLRIIEYYSEIGLYKVKANWHGKPNYTTNI